MIMMMKMMLILLMVNILLSQTEYKHAKIKNIQTFVAVGYVIKERTKREFDLLEMLSNT